MPTPWRKLSYEELEAIEINGSALDIGGSRKSKYHELLKGEHVIEVVNIDDDSGLDKKFNLEDSFPIADENYDNVLAINLLEHIYNYQNIFSETYRILKKNGTFVVAVPFLMFYHPSPNDYWRYSEETLLKLFAEYKFKNISIKVIGKGPFTAMLQMFGGLRMPEIFRTVFFWCAVFMDKGVGLKIKPAVLAKRYPLGYVVVAKK